MAKVMSKVTELTYENMKEMIEGYYSLVPLIKGPEDEDRVRELFSPDFEARKRAFNGETQVVGRDQWIRGLCAPDRWKINTWWAKPPYGLIIDVKQGKAVMVYKDTVQEDPIKVDPPGMTIKEITFCTIWQLCIHDGKVKGKSEYIMHPSLDPLFW